MVINIFKDLGGKTAAKTQRYTKNGIGGMPGTSLTTQKSAFLEHAKTHKSTQFLGLDWPPIFLGSDLLGKKQKPIRSSCSTMTPADETRRRLYKKIAMLFLGWLPPPPSMCHRRDYPKATRLCANPPKLWLDGQKITIRFGKILVFSSPANVLLPSQKTSKDQRDKLIF
jgi:hypothetical protein